ncbi:diguanylate cyclase [Thalassospira povalilytica]|uniref:sensor domain-containing diguanylate cyclase n=1 Tax=Thalassospira povalilytica TaxID=732237 RepID=UPI003AA997A5
MKIDFNELNLKTLLDNSIVGVVIHDWDTSIVYANPRAMDLLEMSYDHLIGKTSYDPQWHFVDEQHRRLMVYEYPVNRVRKTNTTMVNEVFGKVNEQTGDVRWFLVNAYVERQPNLPDGKGFIVVSFNDITDRQNLFSYEHILEHAGDVVIVTEADPIEAPFGPKIVYVNKAFEKLTGYSRDEVIGETPRILQGQLTDIEACRRISRALHEKTNIRETLLNYSKTGKPYWLDMSIMPLFGRNGQVTHFAAIEHDVTESVFNAQQLERRNAELRQIKDSLNKLVQEKTRQLREANIKLEQLAYYDALTGVPNRRSFTDQLQKMFGFCVRNSYPLLVGIFDIDDFKYVNDTHGHGVGDEVLVQLARAVDDQFRIEDVFGRIGGEEFAFASIVKERKAADILCARVLSNARSCRVELADGQHVSITVSLGACFVVPSNGIDTDKVMQVADRDLYEAKRSGKNRFVISQC